MTHPEIHQLHPDFSPDPLDDDHLLSLYATNDRDVRVLRANFVATADGSSTADGVSGPLGNPADKRVFDLLRQLCDVVIVGAGTIRTEGYGAMRLSQEASQWRVANGLDEQPQFAIVSARLDLDVRSEIFTEAPVRPLVVTVESADVGARREVAQVAEVITCGELEVGGTELVEALTARGLTQLHCEGGPRLLGTLIADDALDELCLTTSSLLEGGFGSRITSGGSGHLPLPMSLDHVLISESTLFTKYSRVRGGRHDDAQPAD